MADFPYSLAVVGASSSEPNWLVTTFAGAVIGALIAPSLSLLKYLLHRSQNHPLHGLWFSYQYTFIEGERVLRYGVISVRNGIRHRYVAIRQSSADPPTEEGLFSSSAVNYKGYVFDELDHYVMVLTSRSHSETSMWRFLGRVSSNDTVTPGLRISYDYDGNPTAGAVLLSREPLADEEAARLIGLWTVVQPFAMKVQKTPTSQKAAAS
jgi:hypothetical protein